MQIVHNEGFQCTTKISKFPPLNRLQLPFHTVCGDQFLVRDFICSFNGHFRSTDGLRAAL